MIFRSEDALDSKENGVAQPYDDKPADQCALNMYNFFNRHLQTVRITDWGPRLGGVHNGKIDLNGLPKLVMGYELVMSSTVSHPNLYLDQNTNLNPACTQTNNLE